MRLVFVILGNFTIKESRIFFTNDSIDDVLREFTPFHMLIAVDIDVLEKLNKSSDELVFLFDRMHDCTFHEPNEIG